MSGLLISLEGLDGVGKSTQLELLRVALESAGHSVLCLREPGGTAAGEKLRELLKAGLFESALAELLAFETARSELVQQRIRPALEAGQIVILDRFTDSSLAYQGAHGSIELQQIEQLNRIATGSLRPDLTIWLDLEPGTAMQRRAQQAELDSIEQRDDSYFRRVREIFAGIAAEEPQRFKRLDASGSIEQIHNDVMQMLQPLLETVHG